MAVVALLLLAALCAAGDAAAQPPSATSTAPAATTTPPADPSTPTPSFTKVVPGSVLEVEPLEAHDFGDVPVGQQRAFTYVAINVGGSQLTGTASTPCAGFSVSPTGLSLSSGQQVDLVVRFTPPSPGELTCQLVISSNGGSETLPLRGVGAPPQQIPILSSPTSPGGLLLMALLAVSMAWWLRRGPVSQTSKHLPR